MCFVWLVVKAVIVLWCRPKQHLTSGLGLFPRELKHRGLYVWAFVKMNTYARLTWVGEDWPLTYGPETSYRTLRAGMVHLSPYFCTESDSVLRFYMYCDSILLFTVIFVYFCITPDHGKKLKHTLLDLWRSLCKIFTHTSDCIHFLQVSSKILHLYSTFKKYFYSCYAYTILAFILITLSRSH